MTSADFVNLLTNEECRQLLAVDSDSFFIDESLIESIVKEAIDKFDPYALNPGVDAPSNEYDPESRTIAKKVTLDMSVEEIAGIIKDVFVIYFDASFPLERYYPPTKEIHHDFSRMRKPIVKLNS